VNFEFATATRMCLARDALREMRRLRPTAWSAALVVIGKSARAVQHVEPLLLR